MSKSVFVLLEESKEDQSIEVLMTADSYDQIKMMISEVELRHLKEDFDVDTEYVC